MATERARRGQALMELAVGMFTLALVVSALGVFATYIARSLRVQNSLRGTHHATNMTREVELDRFSSEYLFGSDTLTIKEHVEMPPTGIGK